MPNTHITTATGRTTQQIPVTVQITAQWNAAAGKLRIARADTDQTIAVYSSGAVYKMAPEVPAGQVTITPPDDMPELATSLLNMGVIAHQRSWVDPASGRIITVGRVLL